MRKTSISYRKPSNITSKYTTKHQSSRRKYSNTSNNSFSSYTSSRLSSKKDSIGSSFSEAGTVTSNEETIYESETLSSIHYQKEQKPQQKNKRITINVSGTIFETFETTLDRFPKSLLGDKKKRSTYYCTQTDQYYFNRNRKTFECILFFYQSNGNLYRPFNVNLILFLDDCAFFQLPAANVDVVKSVECCFLTDKIKSARSLPPVFVSNTVPKIQCAVWNFLEYPESSNQARVYFIGQIIFVALSIALFSSESLFHRGEMAGVKENKPSYLVNHQGLTGLELDSKLLELKLLRSPFLMTEFIITLIFALDFLMRCVFSPHKRLHFTSFYTYLDIVCLVPYSLLTSTDDDQLSGLTRILKFLRFLRLFKLVRLLTRVSKNLKVLFVIIKDCWRDLQIFILGVILIVFFSAAIVFVCEATDEDTKFNSIPNSMWWSLQACITLGYGDIVPQTNLGRLVSSVYMVYGLIWMMLPIIALGLKVVTYGAEARGQQKVNVVTLLPETRKSTTIQNS